MWYNKIIERSQNRVVNNSLYEKHHVIPKCVGGKDIPSNIALLTPEEHYVCHQLLIKIYPGNRKLIFAANMMCVKNGAQKRNNKLYGWIRRKLFKRVYLKCNHCKKEFNVTNSKHKREKTKFCSMKCYKASVHMLTKYRTSNCVICENAFTIPVSFDKIKLRLCCSKVCGIKLKQKNAWVDITCEMCGKIKNKKKSRIEKNKKQFCDKYCYKLYKKNTCYTTYTCIHCNKEKTVYKNDRKTSKFLFCSSNCHLKYRKKNNIPRKQQILF